ncbi:thioester domain-containing protein [Arthrobacter sp. zg-Y844]|uniref:thioester domain-containing protein n=1 Tax=Arthrobacter sp. zg-Y844 TaxID=2964612 RepID=UPI00210259BA|nr:thioester domain-containing protein [Arthrobacter sp. zg-Y844]MCQ1987893.1 thioester domain-containing protein [Arthrobacter sp. zg-Y844]
MSSQLSPAKRPRHVFAWTRTTRVRRILVFLLTLALAGFPLAVPAQAQIVPEPPRNEAPADAANTDIVITSLGAGRSVSGGLPPLGQTWPIDAYPAGVPAGYQTENVSFAGIINTQDAYGTTTAEMYCIDLRTATRVGIGYENGTWDESNIPNIGYVNRILNSYYPTTDLPAGNVNNKAAAVQAAIWFFTDGFVLNRQSNLYSTVAAIVNDTIAAGPLEEPDPPAIAITPPVTEAPVTQVAGPHTVTSEADAIEVTVDEGFSLYADAAGTVPLNSPVPSGTQVWVRSDTGATGPANLTARAAVTVPTGNVYLYDAATPGVENAQKLILAVTRELSSNATAAAAFTEVGSLTVTKTIAGPAAGSQDAVVINIDCGTGNQFTFTIDAEATGTLSETFNDIPAGSTCTVTEPTNGENDSVQVSTILPGAVTIVSGTTVTAAVTDTYTFTPGTLVVTKTNTGEAAGAQGEVTISVVCTLDGTTVVDTTVTIPAGTITPEAAEFPDLEAGTSCTVTETVDGSSEAVAVTVTGEGTVTVPAASSVTVALTNDYTFTTGTLAVRKDIAGAGAGRQGVVTLQVTCTAGGATVLNETVTVEAGTTEPATEEFENLPTGASCTVTETADGATTQVSVETVADPAGGTVTIPSGAGVEVTVTNTYTVNPGALTVDKVIAGPAAREQGPITVEVVCTADGEEVIRQDITIEAGAGGTVPRTVNGIPEGASCAVTEPGTGETPAVGVTVDLPDDVTIAAGETAEATVTNTYAVNPGSLTVTKVIAGEAAGNQDSVEIDVLCTLDGETVFEETSQIPAGTTEDVGAEFSNIPAGASCSITEPVTGATAAVTVDSDLPGDVEILAGDTVAATVTNTYSFAPGTLAVTKVFAGDAAGAQGEVVLQVTCGPDGSVLDETVAIPAGTAETVTTNFADLPADTECTVTETETGATATVSVDTVITDPVTIPAAGGAELTVTNTYGFNPGVLVVTKVITGAAAGEQGEVVLEVRCGTDGSSLDETVTIPAGATGEVTTQFDGLTAGAECTVTETSTGATSAVRVESELPDPVSVPANGTASAIVTNTYAFVESPAPTPAPEPEPRPVPAPEQPGRSGLPSTGLSISTGIYLALGAGLCLMGALGIYLTRRRTED